MTRAFVRRTLAGLLVAAVLLVPWTASAAPSGTADVHTASLELLPGLWGYLTRLWGQALAAGCIIDPSGRCSSPPASPDAGCGIDPSGQRTGISAPSSADEGCGVDPSGQCAVPTVFADEGCIIDPSGGCVSNR